MTLEEAVAEFERGRVIADGLPQPTSQTGEPYEVIYAGSFGPQRYGESAEIGLYTSEELAAKWWLESIKRYASDKHGVVYWRTRPDMTRWVVGATERPMWMVYSRLLISDKPPIAVDA